MRKSYLDNIRWATVILVLIYHVFYMFNGVGILGGIPEAANIPAFDWIACIIYPWFMVLLFVIAGMSARYAFQKRTEKQFLKERATKLLIPSTLGLFALHWITGYLNIKMGGGLDYIPPALIYPISAISGTGPLWFIQMLFIFSCILILLRKVDKADRVWTLCRRANLPVILLLFFLIFGAAQILNMPVLTMYRFGIYFAAFLIGYYIFSHEEVLEIIEKIRIPMLCLSVIGTVFYLIRYGGSNFTDPDCLQSVMTNLYLWVVILAIIGCGRKYFNCETDFTRYMTKSSFGIYVLHYPVLIITCYILHYYTNFPAIWKYVIAIVVGLIMTFIVNELIIRVPVLRYFVLGMKMTRGLIFQAISKFILGVVVIGLLIFLPAGTFHYWNAWLLMVILFIPMFFAGIVMLFKNPELLKKRLNSKEQQREQNLVIKLSGLMFVVGFVIAGLNFRFEWVIMPNWISLIAAAIFLFSYVLYAEVLRENAYLSRTVEVQQGQRVIDTGLYGIVRHPMYSVTIIMFLSMPLVLGSILSFVVFLAYPIIIAKRIRNEETVLEDGLEGYAEYKKTVKYKIIPFVW